TRVIRKLPIWRLLVIHDEIVRTPKHSVQRHQTSPNRDRNDDVQPGVGQDQGHDGDHPERRQHEAVVHGGADDGEGLFPGEVEEDPGGEDEQEDDHGERVEDQAEEEDEQDDLGVVGSEVGQVLGESDRSVRDAGGEAQCGGVQELTPWSARGHR
ncbi:hypothetical protein PanWU01x14_299130, partial [Parasponia andersonii]